MYRSADPSRRRSGESSLFPHRSRRAALRIWAYAGSRCRTFGERRTAVMLCCQGYEFVDGGATAFEVDAARLVYGSGALHECGAHAKDLGMTRVALFTDATLNALEPVATVAASLRAAGIDVATYA